MNENYTPSEQFEAADKAKQHKKGREQAKFYNYFLDGLRSRIVYQLLRKDVNKDLGNININETDLPLNKFQFCDTGCIKEYIADAGGEANKIANTSEITHINIDELANMTPMEFYKYIDNLKSSLIKK